MLNDQLTSPVVVLGKCESYDSDLLYSLLIKSFDEIGLTKSDIEGKKVLIKPNLVLAKKPEFAATTHPAFVEACVRIFDEMGASSITLADSPGGPYNSAALSIVYRTCEMAPLASEKLKINDDFSWKSVRTSGVKLKNFHCITPLVEADVVVDLCKLKTHSLTGMSAATKNLFGIIPGVEKFEMHSTFPDINDFSEMLVDLASYVVENKTFIAICDAILSMEGNGPSHGIPKKTDIVLVSRSPFALDVVGEHIISRDGRVKHLDCAAKRNLTPRNFKDINIIGEDCPQFDFVEPDTDAGKFLRNLPNFMGGRLAKLFEVKPKINTRECVGCGRCVTSCPKHTITVVTKNSKKLAKIDYKNCIRCYCCQELCPLGAVGTKQNFLIRIIH